MYKKIISIALSSMMLAQSVSAANLRDFVTDSSKVPAAVITNSQFDYGQFRILFGGKSTKEIPTTVEALASVANQDVYQKDVVTKQSSFDFKVSLDMSEVQAAMNGLYNTTLNYINTLADDADKADLVAQFKASKVSGNFKVEVDIDNRLTGFDLSTATLQQEGRTTPDAFSPTINISRPSANLAVFEFTVADNITIEDLHSDITLLNDLYMIVEDVVGTTKNSTMTVSAELTEAKTTFSDAGQAYGFIDYNSNQDSATVTIRKTTGSDGIDLEDDEPIVEKPKAYLVVTDDNLDVTVDEKNGEFFVDIDAIDVPAREGFTVEGIYTTPQFTEKLTGILQIYEDTYLYPKYINTEAPKQFISDEHILYIVGYPDGEVKPNNNITREEVVAALYRLLDPSYRASIDTDDCYFPDVEEGRWSYDAVAAFQNAGHVVGDPDGSFRPSSPITRAEFVTIVNHFAPSEAEHNGSRFADVAGHWAEDAINASSIDWSWVTGYEDGTFRPNAYITRAEAVTIINKMLVRYGDVESTFAKQWPDLFESDWYYAAMIEATTAHDYTRNADGWSETWIK